MQKTYFEWDKDFMTGNGTVDSQHYKLVELINELLTESLDSEHLDLDNIKVVKEELSTYVTVHFATEEDLMKEYKLSAGFVAEHELLHQEFVNKVEDYFSKESNYNDQLKLGGIVEYLIRWLAYHILNTDKSLVRQLEGITDKGMTPEEAYRTEQDRLEQSTEPLLKALKVLYLLVVKKNRELEERVTVRTKELQDANKKLEEQTYKDSLTGLSNRRFVMKEVKRLINEWERYKVPFSLLFIDVDKFKVVNDQYGHENGDKVLQWIGNYLKDNIRVTDIAARLGGDEFVIICPYTKLEAAMHVGHKLIAIDEKDFIESLTRWNPSISIGVATIDDEKMTASELLKRADAAMYKSKKNGGGKVTCLSCD